MDDYDKQPPPPPVLTADQYERARAMDWVAPEDDSRARTFLFKFLPLFFLCLVAYWSAWQGSFVWQDDTHVTLNASLRSVSGLGLIWTAPTATPDWSPLGYSMFWPQHMVWTDGTPLGYHLISLLIHVFNAMLVWMLLKRLELPWPFVAAMVFALHPVQIEAVAWISRQPLLVGSFWGLCYMIVYLRWSGVDPTTPNPSRIFRLPEGPKKLYTLAFFAMALAMFAAPLMVCTLPLVMLTIIWWKREGLSKKDFRAITPFAVLGLAGAIFNAVIERKRSGAHWSISPLNSVLLAVRGIEFHIQKFFWPKGLTVVHRNWTLTPRDVLVWVMLAGVISALVLLYKRRREVGFLPFAGVTILLLLLVPALTPLNLTSIQTAYVSERFGYLACAVLAAAVIGTVTTFVEPIVRHEKWPLPIAAAVLVCVLSFAVFFGHSNSFASGVALWENTANQDEENIAALINLAKEYENQKTGLPQAMNLYQRVLRLTGRRNLDALINLGKIFEQQKDFDEALRYYQEAMTAAPNRPEPYRQIGPLLQRQGKTDQAIELYQTGITRFPNDDVLYRMLGRAFASQGKSAEAIVAYKKSIAINPYDSDTHVDLGTAYFAMGDAANAVAEIESSQKLDPRNYQMYMSVGEMFVRSQNWQRAYECYRNASYLKPTEAEPCNNVGLVATVQSRVAWQKGQGQVAQDKIKEAIVYLKRALELKPDYEAAKKNMKSAEFIQKLIMRPPPRPAAAATQPAPAK